MIRFFFFWLTSVIFMCSMTVMSFFICDICDTQNKKKYKELLIFITNLTI